MTALPYGYCGMPCALCSRYRAEGKSRCPGCSHDGYYTDMCKAYRCARERGVEHCGLCADYPCARLGGMGDFRDLNTGGVKPKNCALVAETGFDAWYAAYAERARLLTDALARYNDGRMKRFLCETFIRFDLDALRALMRDAESIPGDIKARAAAFRALVAALPEP